MNQESKITKEFSRFAHQYDRFNMIQSEVAQILVGKIPKKNYTTIIDIGCGTGEVYKNLVKNNFGFDKFVALDLSAEMLALHPSHFKVDKYRLDFDNIDSYPKLTQVKEDVLLLSSSAMQWSKNLDKLMRHLSQQAQKAYFAIFTSNTFKTLHQVANIQSPIYSEEELKKIIGRYYFATFQIYRYRLVFKSTREMFQYIKKSGVSGGEKQLSYKETRQLMRVYPLKYLEFEILFAEGTPRI